jgi:glucan phosphoethanolaminetransferase (alkaline phosphatase superfamily)
MKVPNLKYNFILSISLALLFIFFEIVFRFQHDALINPLKISGYLDFFLVFFILSFVSSSFLKFSLHFLSLSFVFEIAHFNYYGYFIFPLEYILLFTKSADVYQTLITKLDTLLYPATSLLVISLIVPCAIKCTKDRLNSSKFNYVLVLILLFVIAKTTVNYKEKILGEIPNDNKSIIKNSLYTTKAFIGKTLPLYLFDISSVASDEIIKQFSVNEMNKIDNVVLVIGESLSKKHMSLYGYPKPTSELLKQKVENDPNMLALEAISSGVVTDTSVPMLLNIAKKPDPLPQILGQETNLFKMAKDNGFITSFISAQSNKSFSYIRSYMGMNYIDKYIDSSDYGFDNYSSALDNILLEETKKINFNKKNFVVLSMRGSHSPYKNRTPENFKPFGDETELQEYENSVSFTDKILSEIIDYIKINKTSKTLFIFTSDHGESVGPTSYGHGNINNSSHYIVPLVLYSHNFKFNDESKKVTEKLGLVSHFNLSLLCAYYLGYESLGLIDWNKSYVNGQDLSGNAGYVEYDMKTKKVLIK